MPYHGYGTHKDMAHTKHVSFNYVPGFASWLIMASELINYCLVEYHHYLTTFSISEKLYPLLSAIFSLFSIFSCYYAGLTGILCLSHSRETNAYERTGTHTTILCWLWNWKISRKLPPFPNNLIKNRIFGNRLGKKGIKSRRVADKNIA